MKSAINLAKFFINKSEFNIQKVLQVPIIVNKEDFDNKDIELKMFHHANEYNIAFYYIAIAINQNIPQKEVQLQPSYKSNLSDTIAIQKELSNQGRCLHYQANNQCNEIIKAHSLQKKGILQKIARKGKIYSLSSSLGNITKNNGKITLKETGINKFSIFKGFCKKHDNELFSPIDNYDLDINNSEQFFLYSYRALSKEVFHKQNALNLYKQELEKRRDSQVLSSFISNNLKGIKIGYNSLIHHKNIYDNILNTKNYTDIRYISFNSTQPLSLAFSSVLYPQYDFFGNLLQDLSNNTIKFDLFSFSSAPTKEGWSFIFSWHKSSDKSCFKFIKSIQGMLYQGHNLNDILFRFVIKSCENIAFSPIFWELLTPIEQDEVSNVITSINNPFTDTIDDYLQKDLTGISKWVFSKVNSSFIL